MAIIKYTTVMEQKKYFDFSIIKTLRMKWGLSAEELAGRAGITRATVAKLESGNGNPTVDTICAVGKVFALSAAELIRMAETPGCEMFASSPYHQDGFDGILLKASNFEIYHLRACAGTRAESRAELHQNTAEICMVISGKVKLFLKDKKVVLNSGEAVRFKALQEHRFEIIEDTQFLLIHHILS